MSTQLHRCGLKLVIGCVFCTLLKWFGIITINSIWQFMIYAIALPTLYYIAKYIITYTLLYHIAILFAWITMDKSQFKEQLTEFLWNVSAKFGIKKRL